ncbi:spermatid-specific manchette-related protein 1 isoform X2 [Hemicordylus capensis]|uniref:spermatid-specific manchette-related protein 1 isoform X2 n=1 Tax=Hemicordylus capensis TaxID=884348 RepID=UPI00230473D7|nr:spermatid-specific manchette-related protein 1 isoform X2 [Hemicordylus capensis]
MFIFAHKTSTPLSTYTDSYRAPRRTKDNYEEPSFKAWEQNKYITQGLTVPRVESRVDQAHLEKMVKRAVQEYSYKNTMEPSAYRPYKYWVTREEEKFNPVFCGDDRYATWRTGPYNSAAWNRYTTYLPRIPREAGMESILRGMPMQYPPKPERLNNYEREVVVNMLNSLSRKQLPAIQHQYSIPGRMPYQGYYSPCSGRHYCLRGMDYYVDGAPTNERQISQLVEKIVRNFPLYDHHQEMMLCAPLPSLLPSFPYMNLRWDTSHFKRTGGPLRDSYIIHPEFVSESHPMPPCW